MSSLPWTFAEDVIDQPARAQFEVFLNEHRVALNGCLDGGDGVVVIEDERLAGRRGDADLGT